MWNKKQDNEIDFSCPRCKSECKFFLKTFSNGTQHIQKSCPIHGHIKYVRNNPAYLEKAVEKSEVNKSIFDF
jgi:phage FluMu protein Com